MKKSIRTVVFKRLRSKSRAERGAWLLVLALTAVYLMQVSLASKAAESAEPGAGFLTMQRRDSDVQSLGLNALQLSASSDVEIHGMVAGVKLRQVFHNNTEQWQEGRYVFPLPSNAAVYHMEIQVGERVIVAEVKEKQEAKKIYQQALRAGKVAALSTQQRPNIFVQKVANIAPDDKIQITLYYRQRVDFNQGVFELRLPTTLTPRYRSAETMSTNSDPEQRRRRAHFSQLGWALATVPESPVATPIRGPMQPESQTIDLHVRLNVGLELANIESLYHNIQIDRQDQLYILRLTEGPAVMDRDIVLQWRVATSSLPEAAIFRETLEGEEYALLLLIPPQQPSHGSFSRELCFVIDISGSMQGSSIIQAKQSLLKALAQLRPEDQFNIIAFSSEHRALFSEPHTADEQTVATASDWVNRLEANGGTEMLPALRAAMTQFQSSGNLQQLVFITDGAVSNEQDLFHSIYQYLGEIRLFTVAIGSAPNSFFMRKAAQFGRGSYTHISSSQEVSHRMEALFQKMGNTLVSGITVQWPQHVEMYPAQIPDLYQGEPLLVAAKSNGFHGRVIVDGYSANSAWNKSFDIGEKHKLALGISTVWAKAKIDALEDEKHRGKDSTWVKEEVTRVALQHKIVSAYTSLIAVEKDSVRNLEDKLQSSVVKNIRPKGQQLKNHGNTVTGYESHQGVRSVSYPQGATSANFSFYFGLRLLLLWGIYHSLFYLCGWTKKNTRAVAPRGSNGFGEKF